MQHISSDVAFSAKMPDAQIHLVAGVRVVYSDVINNIGDAYNATTGVFTAPVSGIYSFAVTTTPTNAAGHITELIAHGEVQCTAYSRLNLVLGTYVTDCTTTGQARLIRTRIIRSSTLFEFSMKFL